MTETFGQMLKRFRERVFLSQNALARLVGCDPAYVHRFEKGSQANTVPSRRIVLALADALDISARERDRFLFAAGLAPEEDWQARAESAEAVVGVIRERIEDYTSPSEPVETLPFIRRPA